MAKTYIDWRLRPLPGSSAAPVSVQCRPIELDLLLCRLRDTAKFEDRNQRETADLCQELVNNGFYFRAVAQDGFPPGAERGMASLANSMTTVFAASDPVLLQQLIDCDTAQRSSGQARPRAIAECGRLLHYPECCSQAFSALDEQNDEYVLQRLRHRMPAASHEHLQGLPVYSAPGIMNFLVPGVSPVLWTPCSLVCPESIEQGNHMMGRLLSRLPSWTSLRSARQSGLCLMFSRFALVHLTGARLGDRGFHYDGALDAASFEAEERFLSSNELAVFRRDVTSVLASGSVFRIETDNQWVVEDGNGTAIS